MDSERFLKKLGIHLGIAVLFTFIYGIGVLLLSPFISMFFGGINGVLIGNALFAGLLGFIYVKLLRETSFKDKLTGSIIGTIIISIFSSYQKITFESVKSLSQTFSQTRSNLPNSQVNPGIAPNVDGMIDPIIFFTINILFFNLPFIYSIKENQQIPKLKSKETLIILAYLIPIAIYTILPKIYGA